MKKNTFFTILTTAFTIFTLSAVFTGTMAWFTSTINISSINGSGSTMGAYFAYGDGKPLEYDQETGEIIHQPYGISEIRHLNNLAWLQYNGTFDDDHYCFELANDINVGQDSSEFVMPPIGTETHPFIGVFDGNGYTINNIKVTNDANEFTRKPVNITYIQNNTEVVGFFGVVGRIDDDSYSSSINKMIDVTLDNITVESKTTNTLIGIAAGYVNAEMSGVKVGTSTISVNGNSSKSYTNNLSNYGLVGYTTKTGTNGSFTQKLSNYYDSNSAGDDPGWGGSIDMKAFFTRLDTIRTNYSATSQSLGIVYDDVYDSNDTRISHEVRSEKTYSYSAVYNEDYSKNNVEYDQKIGALKTRYGNLLNGQIYYLGAGHYSVSYNGAYSNHTGYPIKSGDNHLCLDLNETNNLKNNVSPTKPTLWTFPETGSTGDITTIFNGTTYYLENNNGSLRATTASSSSTQWNIESITPSLRAVNNNLVIDYQSGWVLSAGYYYRISYTSGSTYYLTVPNGNTNVGTTTDINQATFWYYNSNRYYPINTNNSYIGITCTRTNTGGLIPNYTLNVSNPAKVGVSGNYTSNYTFDGGEGTSVGKSGYFSASVSGSGYFGLDSTTFYLNYNGSTLGATSQSGSKGQFIVTKVDTSTAINKGEYRDDIYGPDADKISEKSSGMDYSSDQDVTYLPLAVENNLQAKKTNTGYIMGGDSFTSSTTSSQVAGNVRISSGYTIADNLTNYNVDDEKFDDNSVWTFDSTGLHPIDDAKEANPNTRTYAKYIESKGHIEKTLSEGSNIYGLHFTNAQINKNNLVTARYAAINGYEYTNYQMPANSIDFNLRDQGYINFFAGTYGNYDNGSGGTSYTVDSFFSLHQIQRSGSTIIDINEIEEIYTDGISGHSYIYKFNNGKYSVPYSIDPYNSKRLYVLGTKYAITDTEHGGYSDGIYHQVDDLYTGYSKVFDMSWLKDNTYDDKDGEQYHRDAWHKAFYFEIPTNPGEYALGTVAGKSYGAYLMYLDIAANAANKDKINAYGVSTFKSSVSYPVGIDFDTTDESNVDGGQTLGIIVSAGSTGDASFTVDNENDTITYESDYNTKYAYSTQTVSGADPPAAADIPPANGTRIIHTNIVSTDNTVWNIITSETLDESGTSTSTPTYISIVHEDEVLTVDDLPESFAINSIRGGLDTIIATFDRLSGKNEFNISAQYSGAEYKVVVVSLDATGITLQVRDIATGYTITVNTTQITADPQTYPS